MSDGVPTRPRRASSATFSYAAAVRGEPQVSQEPTQSPTVTAAPASFSATGTATPKDIDADMSALSLRGDAARGSSLASSEPVAIPISTSNNHDYRQAHRDGQYLDHFPAPSSPSSPPLSLSPMSAASSSSPRSPRSFGSMSGSSPSGNAWGHLPPRSSGTQHSLDAVLLGADEAQLREQRRTSRSPGSILPADSAHSSQTGHRRPVMTSSVSSPKIIDTALEPRERETFGLRSFCHARMTGFYFFRHSEPYQELSLRYVPSTNRGGSAGFSFR